jgi:hypothetical protein
MAFYKCVTIGGSQSTASATQSCSVLAGPQRCTVVPDALTGAQMYSLTQAGAAATMARSLRLQAASSRRANAHSNGPVGSRVGSSFRGSELEEGRRGRGDDLNLVACWSQSPPRRSNVYMERYLCIPKHPCYFNVAKSSACNLGALLLCQVSPQCQVKPGFFSSR